MSESLKKCVRWAQVCVLVPTIFLGIAVLVAYGKWLGIGNPWVSCVKLGYLKDGFVVLGVFMLISGLVSLVMCYIIAASSSSHDDDHNTVGLYLLCGILVDLVCLGFVIIVFVVTTYSGSPHPAPGRAYAEYRFNHFTLALRNKVSDPYKWVSIITCLSPSDECLALNKAYPLPQQLFNAPLAPLQSGCCMPPAECGFNFVSPTRWTSPTNNTHSYNYTNADCAIWSNDPTKFCYSCKSCKAGSLANIRKNLINTNIVLFVTAMVSFILHVCSCFLISCERVNRFKEKEQHIGGRRLINYACTICYIFN